MLRNARGGSIGERGQIAIFVALIFQVLFVFFAMVVNVGMLVHQKINLQNSVDLAAYYGAMRQAETLNAIAHINYQVRQAWKLMVWRYRHLGMSGDTVNHPYDSLNKVMRAGGTVDQPFRAADGGSCPATFCINHPVFDIQEPWEYYCRDMCKGVRITLLGIPSERGINFALAEGILGGLARSIEDASRNLVDKTQKHCRNRSALNWFALARFIFAYKQEMKGRKQVLNRIANGLSAETRDFKDVDGQSARAGALATLWRNLSYPNQEYIDDTSGGTNGGEFAFYNSLGSAQCGGTEGEDRIPPKWLSEVFLKPVYVYLEGDCDGSTQIGYDAKPVNLGSTIYAPRYQDGLDPNMVQQLMMLMADPTDISAPANRLWHSTAGYEKNPWCMAYVGVEASTSPKIPFNPFGNVKLTARSFAKPFGGRVGPWYHSRGPTGAMASNGGPADMVDKNLPPRVRSGEDPGNITEDNYRADFSRYTGDVVGNKSTLTMGQVSRGIWNRNLPPQQASWSQYGHLLAGGSDVSAVGNPGDVLAWNSMNNTSVPLRELEVGFVIPDQFDITYYSIEPDFWRNYATRIQKRPDFATLQVRGDLGFRSGGGAPWATMTVVDQLQVGLGRTVYDYNNTLSYYIGKNRNPANAFVEALTSWHMNQPGDYSLVADRFGNCPEGAIIPKDSTSVDMAVPGNCLAGGRTGYSVKLVDGEYLQQSNLELGGQGQTGPLMNPWAEENLKE